MLDGSCSSSWIIFLYITPPDEVGKRLIQLAFTKAAGGAGRGIEEDQSEEGELNCK